MDVALRDRYRTVPGDSGKYKHIATRFFPKIGQRRMTFPSCPQTDDSYAPS
jgi:hypothetical protein